MEGSIVGDIDNDGEAEIIVTSEDSSADSDRIAKLRVYKSNTYKWAPARKVWNQFAYYNTHVNDNMTIPQNQANHGQEFFSDGSFCPETFQRRPLNAFNVQSTLFDRYGCPDFPRPDAEILIHSSTLDTETDTATVYYSLLNRGDEVTLPGALNIIFYDGNPLRVNASKKAETISLVAIQP